MKWAKYVKEFLALFRCYWVMARWRSFVNPCAFFCAPWLAVLGSFGPAIAQQSSYAQDLQRLRQDLQDIQKYVYSESFSSGGRTVTGCPVKLIGTGEKLDELETFHPDRIASRILGMGDVVSLVEKVSEAVEEEEAGKLAAKLKKGQMDFNDLASQLRQVTNMGGLSGVMGMLPGVGKMQKQMAEANLDEGMIRRQEAIILSMTPDERVRPKLIQASRKRRIAAGSGTSVQDVNKLMKQLITMNKMMKKMGKMGQKGMMRHGLSGMTGMPGLPPGFGGR